MALAKAASSATQKTTRKTDGMPINIGIKADDRAKIADGLAHVLADTFALYLKTHYFHWNVTGPMFNSLHNMFDDQYNELWTSLDEIAERIRALGHMAPGAPEELIRLSSIKSTTAIPDAQEMVALLVEGREAVVRTARALIDVAEDGGDNPTADMMIAHVQAHEKAAWMLRSLLE